MNKKIIEADQVVVKFAGDSGDGMQLTGTQFSNTTALQGDDLATFPDYPAEIRAPQGTVGGVSGFQLHFGKVVHTPGDFYDVLVAMNPAALKTNLKMIKAGGTIIIDEDSFTDKNFKKADWDAESMEHDVNDFNVIEAPITALTKEALKDSDLSAKDKARSKNMFALGIVYRIFDRELKHTEEFFTEKFKKKPEVAEANTTVLRAGFNFAVTVHLMPSYRVHPAKIEKGTYRNISGNQATAWGLLAAAEKAELPFFLGSYPITPASEILQYIEERHDLGAKAFQAEDEIGGIVTAIGASFAGQLAATSTSGPGLALKSEAIGLAVITELPLVIVNVQRGGPSTGLPTKTEQADLFQALYGRNGESPVPVIAADSPSNCFHFAYEASKIALEHMTPVILLTDGFLANGSEPMKIPAMKEMAKIKTQFAGKDEKEYLPYVRDPETYVRKWAAPGMPGMEHRIGGLEKDAETGNVSYIPINHQKMVETRARKVEKLVDVYPELQVEGYPDSDILLVGWGSTYGHLATAVRELAEEGIKAAHLHFRYINPLPKNTGELLKKFKTIIVFEINRGQFADYLTMKHPENTYKRYNKIQGLPFTVLEIKNEVRNNL